MSDNPIIYRYHEDKGTYRTVPARDLTQVDYDRLSLDMQVAVDTGDVYSKVSPKKPENDGKTKGGDQ